MCLVKSLKTKYFFDSASFTPINKKVFDKIKSVFKLQTGFEASNPNSFHSSGVAANKLLEEAREDVAKFLQMNKKDVLFTSGGTESNILALRTALGSDTSGHILISSKEHDSLKRFAKSLPDYIEVEYIEADERGYVHPAKVAEKLRKDTKFVGVQYVNSITGMIQPIKEISRVVREKAPSAFIYSDCVQASAYHIVSPDRLGVDGVGLDGSKMFAAQGIGVFAIKEASRFKGMSGEYSNWDIRPGTASVALAFGLGEACKYIEGNRDEFVTKLRALQLFCISQLKESNLKAYVYGVDSYVDEIKEKHLRSLSPHILYLSFPNVNHAYLSALLNEKGFLTSASTACSRHSKITSDDGLRVSFLPSTKEIEIKKLVETISKVIDLAKNN